MAEFWERDKGGPEWWIGDQPVRRVPPIPEVISPGRPRETPRSEGILETITHATAGEALRMGLGAQKIGAHLFGTEEEVEALRGRMQALGAEQMERFEERPVATLAGQMSPFLAIPGAAVSTLPRAMGTGGAIGLVGGGGDPLEAGIGAAAGAGGYAAGRALAAPFSKLEPFQRRALQEGRAMNIRGTPAQETGSKFLQMLENSLESNMLTRGATERSLESFQEVANQVAARSIGETGDVIDDLTLGNAAQRIGQVFEDAGRNVKAPLDDAFLDDIGEIEARLVGSIVGTDSAKTARTTISTILKKAEDNVLTGRQLNAFSSELKQDARALLSGDRGDRKLGRAFNGIASALDDLLARNVTPDKAAGLRQAKEQWRNLVFIEQPGVLRGGQVSSRTLANVLRRRAKHEYQRGGRTGTATPTDQLFSIARYGEAFPQLPSSGTAQRLSVPVAGSAVGGMSAATGDLFTGAALGLGAPAALSRLYGRYPFATGLAGMPARYGPPIGRETARTVLGAVEAQRGRQ